MRNRSRVAAGRIPKPIRRQNIDASPPAPKEIPWALEACPNVLPLWDYPKTKGQTSEVLDQVEKLIFQDDSGVWADEDDRRFRLWGVMEEWLMKALTHYG
jgi:hypothetical protein